MRTRTRQSAKAAGRKWEKDVAEYLSPVFPYAERRRQHGAGDRGDLINTRPWVVECKATQTINLSGGCDEAQAELNNDPHCWWWALVVKRRNKGTGDGYAVMSLEQLRHIMDLLEGLKDAT